MALGEHYSSFKALESTVLLEGQKGYFLHFVNSAN